MRYGSRKRGRNRGVVPLIGTGFVVLSLLGVFVFSVYQFRKPDVPEAAPASTLTASAPATTASLAIASAASDGRVATLHAVAGSSGLGTATRSEEDSVYRLQVKTTLPGIDRASQFYEGWLLRPIPYAYFSVGEMVTNDLGEFVLEWNGEEGKTYNDYTQVVITLEAMDGNPDPAGHVLEGEFE